MKERKNNRNNIIERTNTLTCQKHDDFGVPREREKQTCLNKILINLHGQSACNNMNVSDTAMQMMLFFFSLDRFYSFIFLIHLDIYNAKNSIVFVLTAFLKSTAFSFVLRSFVVLFLLTSEIICSRKKNTTLNE